MSGHTDDIGRLREVGAEAAFPAGSVVIERGLFGGGLFLIEEGTVVVDAPEGDLLLGPGSVIGERALLSPDGTRAARVRAKSDLRVIAVDRLAFERLCSDDTEFATRVSSLQVRAIDAGG